VPAILELLIDTELSRPVVHPARLHGAACALLGHPEKGRPPAFSTRPPEATDTGAAVWRVGWLPSDPPPNLPTTVLFGDDKYDILAHRVAEVGFAELTSRQPLRRARIDVVSPMYFSRGERDLALPDPELMVQSLLNRWEVFAPPQFAVPRGLRAELLSSVFLVEMHGHTVSAPVGKVTMQTGFLGSVTVGLTRKAAADATHLFAALIGFAGIAGIGAQSGHGFGAVEVSPVDRPPARAPGTPRGASAHS